MAVFILRLIWFAPFNGGRLVALTCHAPAQQFPTLNSGAPTTACSRPDKFLSSMDCGVIDQSTSSLAPAARAPDYLIDFILGIVCFSLSGSSVCRGSWYRHALAAQPKAIWINRFLAAALVHAGERHEGNRISACSAAIFPN
jgi:hypothetical protein